MATPKSNANKRKAGGSSLAQFGLMDMPDLSSLGEIGMDDGSDEGDEDLEAELQAIISGKAPPRPVRRGKQVDIDEIGKRAKECLKDISDEEEDDQNLFEDETLMEELHGLVSNATNSSPSSPSGPKESSLPSQKKAITTPSPPPPAPPPRSAQGSSLQSLIEGRLEAYKGAEAYAKASGDSTRARRYGRAVKTLEGQLKLARSGAPVNEEEIPPPPPSQKPKSSEHDSSQQTSALASSDTSRTNSTTSLPKEQENYHPPPPVPRAKLPSPESRSTEVVGTSKEKSTHSLLCGRRDQYKMAALQAKRMEDKETAIRYVKISKQFDAVIKAIEEGQPVDLSKMPPPPSKYTANVADAKSAPIQSRQLPQVPASQVTSEVNQTSAFMNEIMRYSEEPEDPNLFGAPPPPATILEALEQRLQKFQSTLETAKSENNNSKIRRFGRIIKQYEDAIKLHKAGKPVDYDELPSLPGFAPIPKQDGKPSSQHDPSSSVSPTPNAARPAPPPPVGARKTPNQAGTTPHSAPQPGQRGVPRKPLQKSLSTLQDKQLGFLLERQRLFREAALDCKKKGDIQNAKEYLKMSKGLDPMIEATKCGLPIDATTIPTPPQLNEDFVIIEKSECENLDEDKEERFQVLEKDLSHQIDMCLQNKEYFFKLGDVLSASKFEKLAQETKRDLSVVQNSWKRGDPLPRYHYETRVFSMVQSHTDLSDSELELTIERGINLPGKPDDLDSYIRIEFPFPHDDPIRLKSHTVKDTNNPAYKAAFKIEFSRKSRSIIRSFKKPVKLEVWSKGGFFKSDSLLGTAYVKLADLETKCTLHDSFNLMEGRKNCGGSLEVKVRVREPLLAKQVEKVTERWLVIGS